MNELTPNLGKWLALSHKNLRFSETAAGGPGRPHLGRSPLPFRPLTHRNAPLLSPLSAASPRPPARPQPFGLASFAGPYGNRSPPPSPAPPPSLGGEGKEGASLPPGRSCSPASPPAPVQAEPARLGARGRAGESGTIGGPACPVGTRGRGETRQPRRGGAGRSEGNQAPRPAGSPGGGGGRCGAGLGCSWQERFGPGELSPPFPENGRGSAVEEKPSGALAPGPVCR